VETFFCRHGKLLIMGARFLDGLRQLNGIVAGMAWMPWRQFLFYSSLGAGFWVGFWGVLAYRLGEGVAHVGDVIIKVELCWLDWRSSSWPWRSFFCCGGTGRGQTTYSLVVVLVPYS